MRVSEEIVVAVFFEYRNCLLEKLIGVEVISYAFVIAGELVGEHGMVVVIFLWNR